MGDNLFRVEFLSLLLKTPERVRVKKKRDETPMNNDSVMIGNLYFMDLIPYLKFIHAICKCFNGNQFGARNQRRGSLNDEREAKFIEGSSHILTVKLSKDRK